MNVFVNTRRVKSFIRRSNFENIPEEINKRFERSIFQNFCCFSSKINVLNEFKRFLILLLRFQNEIFQEENSILISFFLHQLTTEIHRPSKKKRFFQHVFLVDRQTEVLSIFLATSSFNLTFEIVPVWSVKLTLRLKTSFVPKFSPLGSSKIFIWHSASEHSVRVERLQKTLKNPSAWQIFSKV